MCHVRRWGTADADDGGLEVKRQIFPSRTKSISLMFTSLADLNNKMGLSVKIGRM